MNAEHSPKTPTAKTGFFAMLCASLRIPGTSAPSFRLIAALALATATLTVLALTAAPASAATPNFCPPGSAAGHCNNPQGVAVDQSTGTVYLAERNNARVSAFDEHGNFLRAFGYGVLNGAEELQTCTTQCVQGREFFFAPYAVAVDNSAGPSAGDLYASSTVAAPPGAERRRANPGWKSLVRAQARPVPFAKGAARGASALTSREPLLSQPGPAPPRKPEDLPNRPLLALAGIGIGIAILALASGLGLLFTSVVFGYPSGGLA